MPSPFPGMDPYLESPRHWGSVHNRLNGAIEAQLNRGLPPGYVAELDQYVWLTEEPGEPELLVRPDAIVARRDDPHSSNGGGMALVVAQSVLAEPTVETTLGKSKRRRKTVVKITTADGAQVLTLLEVLSPSNKSRGAGRTAYLARRSEYLAAGVNLVEIDLLRAGDRPPVGAPQLPATDYYVVICPAERPTKALVWAFGVREAIPVVAVPFKAGLAPVALDVRACLDRAYDDGRYRDKLRYDGACDPPLRKGDGEWAEAFGRA